MQTAIPLRSRMTFDNICLRNIKLDRLLPTFSIKTYKYKKEMRILEFSLVTGKVLSLICARKKKTHKKPSNQQWHYHIYNTALFSPMLKKERKKKRNKKEKSLSSLCGQDSSCQDQEYSTKEYRNRHWKIHYFNSQK